MELHIRYLSGLQTGEQTVSKVYGESIVELPTLNGTERERKVVIRGMVVVRTVQNSRRGMADWKPNHCPKVSLESYTATYLVTSAV